MYEKIKMWYDMELWTDSMVQDAVDKEILTPEQYEEITGK